MPIRNCTQDTVIALHVELANTSVLRMKGLIGRAHLLEDHALIIHPCQSVHMMFMAFAIDVIFTDREQKIIGLCACLKPFQFSPIFWKSACAIELPAGTIEKIGAKLGDQLSW